MPKEIKLTRGYVALVDDADYEAISAFWWRVNTYRNVCYAARYLRVDGKKTSKSMHSQIMNCPAGMEVDHINCDGLDNRRCNLRIATRSQNRFNQNCPRNSSSGLKGVSWFAARNGWRAMIAHGGKRTYLGFFPNKEDAAAAYDKAALIYHGEFAKTNFPDKGETA